VWHSVAPDRVGQVGNLPADVNRPVAELYRNIQQPICNRRQVINLPHIEKRRRGAQSDAFPHPLLL
jgi:hypothetical protein